LISYDQILLADSIRQKGLRHEYRIAGQGTPLVIYSKNPESSLKEKHYPTTGISLGVTAVKEESPGQVPLLKLYDSFDPVVARSARGPNAIAANYTATLAVLNSRARKVAGSAAGSGSAKLYQWRKGNRETASRPTRVASQSGGLRNLHLGIGTGCRCINGSNDKVHMSAKVGPLLLEQHDDSNLPHCKILLVAQVFVSRYKNVKASGFGRIEQIAVLISAPTFARGRADRMAHEKLSERYRRPLIE
jgi:hypothetical protein